MNRKLAAALFTVLLGAASTRADGCKIARSGRFVPEREQRAMIEWKDGVETLYLAALSDATSESSVWIVPIRAEATAVHAEPVDEFPVVGYYETVKGRARKKIDTWLTITAILDSGGILCPVVFPFEYKSASPATEVARIEKFGMVVTVISAKSRNAIEAYLDANGVNHMATNLASLDSYFERGEYSFVCSWIAAGNQASTATGLKIQFPTPTIWFPLKATRAYSEPVQTIVYTRGFVKPADGCDLPGLKCEYVYGKVEAKGVHQSFKGGTLRELGLHYGAIASEPLSRVTLTADPQQWTQDLELVPGTNTSGSVNLIVEGSSTSTAFFVSALIGAAIGFFIVLATVRRDSRSFVDYLFGASMGAAIVLTIWASLLVFLIWRSARFREGFGPMRRYLTILVLAVSHFVVVCTLSLAFRFLFAWE